jgi:hypothetical protein
MLVKYRETDFKADVKKTEREKRRLLCFNDSCSGILQRLNRWRRWSLTIAFKDRHNDFTQTDSNHRLVVIQIN